MVDQLNAEQLQAASHGDGPMLVLAGPGSGKTTALAARFQYLVQHGVTPESILCITFTRKAAQQLRERIVSATGLPSSRINAGTFHAVARGAIVQMPHLFPALSGRRLIDEAEATTIIRRLLRGHVLDENEAPALIAGFKDRLITAEMLRRHLHEARMPATEYDMAVVELYAAYQRHLEQNRLVDFGDLISGVVHALRADRAAAHAFGSRFRYVMVDEYQDINVAQHALINLLLGQHRNLWVVGDDDQALYGWRHADVRFILEFARNYPDAKIQTLSRNYRSQPVILAAASAIIARNAGRYRKSLVATRTDARPIHLHVSRSADAEAEWIARKIAELRAGGHRPKDMAVLARVSDHLAAFERACFRHGIPAFVVGATPFWERVEVRQALAVLQTLTNTVIDPTLDHAPRWMLERIAGMRRSRGFVPTGALICSFLADNPPKAARAERKAAWKHAMAQLHVEIEQAQSAEGLKARLAAGTRIAEGADAVQICTIHASKGLEWPIVFLAGLEAGVLPHARAEDYEEERRLAFVAITRAADQLYLTMARERGRRDTAPSPFQAEMLSGLPANAVIRSEGLGGLSGASSAVPAPGPRPH